MLVFQKTIDRSALREGFSIPKVFQPQAHELVGRTLLRGEEVAIQILIDGKEYTATLKNQKFDANVHKDHADVMQVRYSVRSPLSKRLREKFESSWQYVEEVKNRPENIKKKCVIRTPKELQEYLVLYTTDRPLIFQAECITVGEKQLIGEELKSMAEIDFETFEPQTDPTATIKETLRIQRVRQLDRSIGDSLKQLYHFTCQMTGERVGEPYEALIAEAHHIDPFTQSLNNDTDNLIILSPNYHRIIHKCNPTFDRKKLAYVFPNGLVEKVKINQHLKKE